MEITVIGGSGFIGSRLSRMINKNIDFSLSIIDINASTSFPDKHKFADVRNIESLRSTINEGSLLINLAAEHRDDVKPLRLYQEVNVNGAKNICNVARDKKVKTIIFTSSVAVYGFAPIGTNESGAIIPFNEYGRTKYEAEKIFLAWQNESASDRTLVILRPTVVFGEKNRGNVYNLLRQISSGKFVMVGNGENRKSMAYVENIAAFIIYATRFHPGVHIYNYADKPDFTMNSLVDLVNRMLGKTRNRKFRIPFFIGFFIGKCFDLAAVISGVKLPISSIRVKKFCSNSVYSSSIGQSGFIPPVTLTKGLEKTIRYEFLESHSNQDVFYTE